METMQAGMADLKFAGPAHGEVIDRNRTAGRTKGPIEIDVSIDASESEAGQVAGGVIVADEAQAASGGLGIDDRERDWRTGGHKSGAIGGDSGEGVEPRGEVGEGKSGGSGDGLGDSNGTLVEIHRGDRAVHGGGIGYQHRGGRRIKGRTIGGASERDGRGNSSEGQEKLVKRFHERYHWPLTGAIVLLLVEILLPERKRGKKVSIVD